MENRTEVSAYLENISILLLGLLFFAFPLLFTTVTTDAFSLPKQVLLIGISLLLMLLSGARMISEGSVRLRRTPFDIALLIFAGVILVSAILAINRVDSLISVIPVLFAIMAFFFTVNLAKNRTAFSFLLSALLFGAALAATITVLSFAKVYVLPLPFSKNPSFTPLGSIPDTIMYLVFLLPIMAMAVYSSISGLTGRGSSRSSITMYTKSPVGMVFTTVTLLLLIAAIGVGAYQLFTVRPLLLPFDIGFQTGFAAISQDTGRTIQGFLFGSGYGTYSVDFTRFKQAAFNLNPTLWSLTFFRSSSYLLELLATAGVLGVLSFGFIISTIIREIRGGDTKSMSNNPLLISLVLATIGPILLPFSPIMVLSFFIILGLYAAEKRLESSARSKEYYDVELHFVAFTEGLIPLTATPITEHTRVQKDYTKILPVSLFVIFVIITAVVGFFTYTFTSSDIIFQRSLVAASQNNGLATYQDQVVSIRTFPYRDAYYRIASQTDLALANSLASSIPRGSSPSAQIQQNVTQLIQESITTARAATQLSPATAVNWQNLSSVYRGLIGFGQNAEQFAVATQQQAIALNPNDPQGYINLGGIYYQLSAWDNAQQAFQTAVNLKPDYANAYYNLGHALESKGDFQNALVAYQTVEQLTAGDKQATEKITGEIEALKKKIANQATAQSAKQTSESQPATNNQESALQTNQPQTQLPKQKQEVKIPPPAGGPKVSVTPSPSTSPTPAQ